MLAAATAKQPVRRANHGTTYTQTLKAATMGAKQPTTVRPTSFKTEGCGAAPFPLAHIASLRMQQLAKSAHAPDRKQSMFGKLRTCHTT